MSQDAAETTETAVAPPDAPAATTTDAGTAEANYFDTGDGGGNPPQATLHDEMSAAMKAAGEAEAAAQAAKLAEITGIRAEQEAAETPPGEEPPEETAEPEAVPPPEPSKPADGETQGAAWRAIKQRKAQLRERAEQIQAREAQVEAAKPLLDIMEAMRSGNRVEALDRFAALMGTNRAQLHLDNISAELDGDTGDAKPLTQADIDRIVSERLEAAQKKASEEATFQQLRGAVTELSGIGKSDKLKSHFPFIGSLPGGKLENEMQQAVTFAHHNAPQYLRDRAGYAAVINDQLRTEFIHQARELLAIDKTLFEGVLQEVGYRSPANAAKPVVHGGPAPGKTADDASRRTTITDTDTSTGGGQREEVDLSLPENRQLRIEAMERAMAKAARRG